MHHPNMPVIVSLDWLIMSIQNNSLQPYHWFQLSEKVQKSDKISTNKSDVNVETKKKTLSDNKALSFSQNPGNGSSLVSPPPKANDLFQGFYVQTIISN